MSRWLHQEEVSHIKTLFTLFVVCNLLYAVRYDNPFADRLEHESLLLPLLLGTKLGKKKHIPVAKDLNGLSLPRMVSSKSKKGAMFLAETRHLSLKFSREFKGFP